MDKYPAFLKLPENFLRIEGLFGCKDAGAFGFIPGDNPGADTHGDADVSGISPQFLPAFN
jgi:hypothetical protein